MTPTMPRRCSLAATLALATLCAGLPAAARLPVPDKQGDGLLISGCGGLPDLARGRQAADDGRVAAAECDLLPLARRGYVEAQLRLAQVYAAQAGAAAAQRAITWYRVAAQHSPAAEVPLARLLLRSADDAQLAESERLFERAEQRGDPEGLAGLIELYTDHPQLDHGQRIDTLVARAEALDQPVTTAAVIRWYRHTPQIDGHPQRLLALCRRSLDLSPECYVDLVGDAHARKDQPRMQALVAAALSQYRQGRVPPATVASIARVLLDQGEDRAVAPPADANANADAVEADPADLRPASPPAPPVIRVDTVAPSCAQTAVALPQTAAQAAVGGDDSGLATRIVERLADGAPEAQVQAAGLMVRYPYLAPSLDAEALLKRGAAQQVAEAPLYLGELYLQGERAARDPQAAQRYLQQAAATPATAVEGDYFLGRLYQYGYLDETQPQRAERYLLRAARAGYASADAALARLYSAGRGVCPNLAYAYLFAELGAREGDAAMPALRELLRRQLDAQQLAGAQALLQREVAARGVALQFADRDGADGAATGGPT